MSLKDYFEFEAMQHEMRIEEFIILQLKRVKREIKDTIELAERKREELTENSNIEELKSMDSKLDEMINRATSLETEEKSTPEDVTLTKQYGEYVFKKKVS